MAWQSRWEQVRTTRLGRDSLGALLGGLLLGLILGLLIGWVWWPVEWQGGETGAAVTGQMGAAGATSQFETPEAKALYLGAVADAFVYASGGGEADAAAVAAQRLAALGGDLQAAFNNAIDFYRAQAGGAVRAQNLATLALAVGIPVDVNMAGTSTTDGQAGAAGSSTSSEGAVVTTTTTTTTGGGSANWLLLLLLALLLIGGGLYILRWMRQQNQGPQTVGGFVQEEDEMDTTTTTTVIEREAYSSARPTLTPAASVRSTVDQPHSAQAGGFESDEADDFGAAGAARYEGAYGGSVQDDDFSGDMDEDDAHYVSTQTDRRTVIGIYDLADDDMQGDEGDEGDHDGEDEEGGEGGGPPAARPVDRQTGGIVTSLGAAPPFSGTQSPAPAQPSTAAQPAPAPRQPPVLQPPTPSRYDQFTPVEGYTATYYLGRTDFDYAKSIPKPDESGGYDGEYGIGIPDYGVLDGIDMQKVIAFSIYLFDKSGDDTEPLTTVSRLLLSHYGDDHRDQFERVQEGEGKRLPPIVAQPNTNFQLEGRRLLLDCLIKQVDYTPEGYFRSATIEIVLKRKG